MRSLLALSLAGSSTACTIGPEPDYRPMPPAPARSEKLAERTRELYTALSLGQADRASLLYSQEPGRVFVGITGNEFKTTSEQRGVAPDEFFAEPGSQIVPGDLIAVADREGGWVVDRPTVRLKNGTELHIRLTLVWRDEYGIWKIVHSHASIAR
jgi:hypothetical protein